MGSSILDSIITEFDVSRFENFFRQKSDNYTPDDEEYSQFNSELFSQIKKLGWMQCDTIEVAVISCKLERNLTERSSKKAQYILGKKILRFLDRYAGGFFIFYDDAGNFRFSFIYSIPKATGRLEWSNFRRYTYYVSKDQTNKTFKQQMSAASFATIEDIIQAFSVEKVTKEFYQQIVGFYNTLIADNKEGIQKYPGNEQLRQEFGVRLLGRLLFCWFLKKKKDVNNEAIVPEQLLSSKIVSQYSDIYHELLEPLFFQVLNTPIDDRLDIYRDTHWGKLPFLNGGLFEPHHSDFYITNNYMGVSQHINTLRIKNNWFKSVFELFEEYNFTIDENSTVDAEISIDPEMLGRIFENLLAEINPETGESARKATGSYYTPREIVEYMVDESLKHYLLQKTGIDEQKLIALLEYDDEQADIEEKAKDAIIDALNTIKVLDPACGSGAFPMGMLHKMVAVLQKVDPSSQKWFTKKIQQIPDPLIRKELEQKIKNENWEYIHKLGIIQNSIFGIDIQPIAIEISKLRFFLSLIVDESIDDNKPNRGIIPLPNLEFKFVAANTLIGLSANVADNDYQINFGDEITLIEELKEIRNEYFTAYGNEKIKVEKKFKETQLKIFDRLKEWITNKDTKSEALVKWDPFSFTSNGWFDPEWMFGVNGGFDIVIGNPPYIQLQKDKGKLANLYENKGCQTFTRMGDIYVLFYERGMQLLKEGGILAYITSNKWMRAGYGEKLRQYFTQYDPKVLIDLGPGVFESATVDTNILLIEKKKSDSNWHVQAVTLMRKNKEPISIKEQLASRGTVLTKLTKDAWFIGSSAEQRLKEKIERIGKPLKDWDVHIYYGIKTGLNEAFIITTEKRNEILANCKNEKERKRTEAIIKPILRGRDIKRYYYEWTGLWVILAKFGFYKETDLYPTIVNHLKKFEKELRNRGQCRYTRNGKKIIKDYEGQHHWLELDNNPQDYYLSEFEKEKVVYSETIKIYFDGTKNYPRFSFTTKEFYLDKTTFFMSGNNQKYFLGILNSYVGEYLLENGYCIKLGSGSRGLQKILIEKIPIPHITSNNKSIVKQIETMVDKILQAKKQNKNADTTPLERQIDQLVYKLYDLTEEEIRIVEGE